MKTKIIPYLFIVAIWFVFSAPFFIFGKVPFPSNLQVNSYSPWSSYKELAGPVKNNAQPDIITQIYPWRYFDIAEFKNGRIPFWNPYSFAGTPHLANYQSAVFFPLNILFLMPIKFIDVWSFLVILQPLLAGLFMFIFVRKLKVTDGGSLVSALSFMFCGFLVTWMGYATLGYALLLLPLSLFLVEQYADSLKYRWSILLSLTIMFSFFSGHFQTSLYFFGTIILYVLYKTVTSKHKKNYASSLFFAFCGLLLAAPQILPSMEFYSQSVRSALYNKVEAIPINYLPTLFAPDFYGNPVTRNDWFGHYAEWSGYAGTIPLLLAFVTILLRRTKITWFFILLGLMALLLAYDTPILSLVVFLKIPVISTSAASRTICLLSFAVAVLSGFGFDLIRNLITHERKKLFYFAGFTLVVILAIAVMTMPIFMTDEKINIARKNLILPAGFAILFVIALICLTFSKNKKLVTNLLMTVVVLVSFEMYRFAWKWQTFDPKDFAFKQVETVNFYNKHFGADRFFADFTAENAVYYSLPAIGGYDPLYPMRFGEFVTAVSDGKISRLDRSGVVFPKFGKFTPRVLNLLGVRYLPHKISDDNAPWEFPFKAYPEGQFQPVYKDNAYSVFSNNAALPRAFVVGKTIVKKEDQEIINEVFSEELMSQAVIEEEDGLVSGASSSAVITEYLPSKVTVKTNNANTGMLILTDNFYPGWKATVNGRPAKIYRANFTFRGVIVPQGMNTIIFTYLPQSFLIGTYLALIGVLGITTSIILRTIKLSLTSFRAKK